MKKILLALVLLINSTCYTTFDLGIKKDDGQPMSCTAQLVYGALVVIHLPLILPVVAMIKIDKYFEAKKNARINLITQKQAQIQNLKPAIFNAVESNDVATLKCLLKQCPVKVFDREGNTPLHAAAQTGNEKVFRIIYRANPGLLQIENDQGKTPVEVAAQHGKFNIIQMLHNSMPDQRSWLTKLTDLLCKNISLKEETKKQTQEAEKYITYPRYMTAHLIPGSPESKLLLSLSRRNQQNPTEEQIMESKRRQLYLIRTGRLNNYSNFN